ncbi:TBC1 domain family member 2B-like isoform X4 [Periplaneta americana]|uniref:TBC1 domain family member 2B-like isoform X4 n=1 Tax=Periplaneta americana TaxID=6978 RepID=UPI0037E781A2
MESNEEKSSVERRLCGYMVVGWDKVASKSRWLVLSPDNCKLYVYKTEHDPLPVKDVDISRAIFMYDPEKSENGQFCIRSGDECLQLEAGNAKRRNYWLSYLRQERRSFGGRRLYLVQHPELRARFSHGGNFASRPHSGLLSSNSKESTLNVAEALSVSPEPEGAASVVLRNHTDDSPVQQDITGTSNQSLSPLSSLGKRIRHSFREKQRSFRLSSDATQCKSDSPTKDCTKCKQLSSQVLVLQEDLKATEDEYEASRQVIDILQAQVEVLTREKDTLLEANKRVLERGEKEILGILEEKEAALTSLEQQYRKLGIQEEQLEGQVERLQDDAVLYKELLQAKDKAIVDLTNQLHESRMSAKECNTRGTQTDNVGESLGDALVACATQNKFLNEELLEVNQLLQESLHREDKLLVEASEWEARFYQIQSKYMLLLNELQVPESSQDNTKFRELITRLMGDSVTGSTPTLRSPNKTYTVYGFQQDVASSVSSTPMLQIETDLLRTLPNNKHYEGMNADGIPKLRRVLLAFSIYNAEVGYCQGLNRIVAILLLFLSEEDAFWGLVYIVEKLMPSDYYGHQLAGAQIDQRVLKDLIAEKMPRLSSHLLLYSVDISLVTFNWFLCIYIDSLPVDLFLRVWDAFLFEGSKVLFRYALAVLKLNETEVLNQTDYVSILTTLKSRVENLTDVDCVTRVAFQELNPFPMKIISQKREHHRKALKVELDKLEAVRREYQRKVVGDPSDTNGNKTTDSTIV